jgi:hypothetical protein
LCTLLHDGVLLRNIEISNDGAVAVPIAKNIIQGTSHISYAVHSEPVYAL